ncbi:MAG: tetratricopeptide repeat protein [Verrucomicrobia bacterium]|nr:tetratricopeptide repeat protein [Verrucomicrobiota bacterium]
MKPLCQFVLVLFVAGGISACRQPSLQKNSPSVEKKSTVSRGIEKRAAELEGEHRARVEALARYATGVSYEANEEPELALEEFYKSALADASDEAFVLDTSRRLLQGKQGEKAIELLQLASKRPETTGLVFALLGRAYILSGKTNEAIAANSAAIKVSPTSIAGYQNLAEIQFRAGKPEAAIKVLEEAAKQQKLDAAFLINLSEIYSKQLQLQPQQFDTLKPRAVELLDRAMKLAPHNTGTQQRLADGFAILGERDRAAALYEELIAKYLEFPVLRDPIREKLANNYLLSGDKKRAAEQLELIVLENPTRYPQSYYVLGTIAFEEKDFARAAEHFNRTILIIPDLEQPYYDLAAAQLNRGHSNEALNTLEKASARFAPNFVGEMYMALASQQLKDYSKAIRHLGTAEIIAKATDPKRLDHSFYYQLGMCHERSRDYESAEKAFLKALELKPDDADVLNYIGYMWAEQEMKLDQARDFIEKALKIEPDNAAFLDSMGWALFKLNKFEQALSYLLRAAELSKEPDPTIYDHIGDVYFSLKQLERAREAWEKSIAIEPNDEIRKKIGSSL